MPDDCWSQEDDELTLQPELLLHPRLVRDRDTISQMSIDSTDSGRLNGGGGAVGGGGGGGGGEPIFIAAGDIRRRLSESLKASHSRFIAFSSTFFIYLLIYLIFFRNWY